MIGPTHRPDEGEALRRQAADWISKISLDGASESDIAALRAWRERSPDHAAAFAAVARTWRALDPVLALSRQEAAFAGVRPRSAIIGRRAVLGGMLGAAAAAAVLMVRPPYGLWPSISELRADYRTGTGEQRTLSVGETAAVELNTETSIALRPGIGGDSGIELIAGEAAVAKRGGADTEFVVTAADGRTTAREATFNIRRDGDTVGVTCLSGTVRVAQRGRLRDVAMGQQVIYAASGLGMPVSVDPGVVAAWRDGMLVFHDQSVARIIDEVNRYRPGRILLVNAALGRRLVTARFEINQLDDVIVQMNRVFGARVTALPGGVVLLG